MSSDDETSDDSNKSTISPIDGYFWRKNEPFNGPTPPTVADMFLKEKYSNPQSRFCDSFVMETLRCRCGYSPFICYSKSIYPGAAYYVCGGLHDRCNFYIWHKDLINDKFRVCKCGLPVVKRRLTPNSKKKHYTCMAFMYKDGCDYCVEVTRYNDRYNK